MADPFSLIGRTPPPPMAKPSFFDQVLGRGSYMQEFSAKRKEIIEESRKEKQRLWRDIQRDKREYELKLRQDNKKLYQEFNIKQSQRAGREGLAEKEQARLREKAWVKINKQMRQQRRAAERAIERQRDEQIKTMRDSLRSGIVQPSDPQQTFNISEYQQSRQSPNGTPWRAA